MKTLEQWVDNYASETLHSWGLKGYTNLLDELKEALMFAVKEAPRMPEQPTTPKPRCDAQGRLLEMPQIGEPHYWISTSGIECDLTQNTKSDKAMLEHGCLFISQPAAEAELTRLKCLQRLRGMEGFIAGGVIPLAIRKYDDNLETNLIYYPIIYGFNNYKLRDAAEATITPEEHAAFLYREPMGE